MRTDTQVGAYRRQLTRELREAGIENAAHEALLLQAHALGCLPGALLLKDRETLDEAARGFLETALNRRRAGEPLQLILGTWPFMGLDFLVRKGALIPRPETEILCEEALREAKRSGAVDALDLGTGSGVLAVCLAHLGGLRVTATDISGEALALARENARALDADVTFLEGDWFAPLAGLGRKFQLIVSNPPYIRSDDIPVLSPTVRDYDPHAALCGGEDGLDAYRVICAGAREFLDPGGTLLLEVGYGQADDVMKLLEGWECRAVKDFAGIDRVIAAKNLENR